MHDALAIAESVQAAGLEMEPLRRHAMGRALAGNLFALLEWWIDKGMKVFSTRFAVRSMNCGGSSALLRMDDLS